MEMSGFTRKVVGELAEALSQYTPAYIKACHAAEAEGLKLTEPERKKREECVAIIDSANAKLLEIAKAKSAHEARETLVAEKEKSVSDREEAIRKREGELGAKETAVKNREANALSKERELNAYSDRLDGIATGHSAKAADLKKWEDSLKKQAEAFDQAQSLIKRA
jgi:hypothetical protein